jgi:hypothetical protein
MFWKMKPAAIGARRASAFINSQVGGAEDNPSQVSSQVTRAELIGSNICAALGLVINSSSPVLALCRALVDAGHYPVSRFEAYRGETLCLRIRSIGESAQLEINGHGTGFKRAGGGGTASPVRQNDGGGL